MSIRTWIGIATGVTFAMAPVIVAFTVFPNDHFDQVMPLSAMIGWGVGAPPALVIFGCLAFWRGPPGSEQKSDAKALGLAFWLLALVCVGVVIWVVAHLGDHLCC